jgi:phenylpropionate dioxygenase-like ring-hydroxylating dioxygenase large terminal subunit
MSKKILGIAALALVAPLFGHHAVTMFEFNKVVALTGTVTKFDWSNPHIHIYLDVAKDGAVEKWDVEGLSPNLHKHQGPQWNAKMLNVGDKITVKANPMKDGSKVVRLRSIVMPDGKELNGGFEYGLEPGPTDAK